MGEGVPWWPEQQGQDQGGLADDKVVALSSGVGYGDRRGCMANGVTKGKGSTRAYFTHLTKVMRGSQKPLNWHFLMNTQTFR